MNINELPDPFEAELQTFRPAEPSPALKPRIAGALADSRTRKKKQRLVNFALVGGLAAASLAALFFGRGDGNGPRNTLGPPRVGSPTVPRDRPEDALPTLRAYQQALARSPEALESLLDRHAARGRQLATQLVRLRAFHPLDPEGQALTGEL